MVEDSLSLLVDAYWLIDGPPSGRNVVSSIATAWRAEFPEDRIVLALPGAMPTGGLPSDCSRFETIRIARNLALLHGIWVSTRLGSRSAGFDAILSQNFTPLFGPAQRMLGRHGRGPVRATFIHDLMFLDHGEWFTKAERLYFRGMALGARHADVILTSSLSEGARISRNWTDQSRKIHPVGLAVPRGLQVANPVRPAQLSTSVERPFILSVGRLNVRKNLARLIEAYLGAEGLRENCDLIIVGSADGLHVGVSARSLPSSVRFLGTVSDSELVWLYQNCEVFVFPSLDEGFGLPLLEARSAGARVVASDIPVFRELGVADILFDPTDSVDIGQAILRGMRLSQPASVEGLTVPPKWSDVVGRIRSAIREAQVVRK